MLASRPFLSALLVGAALVALLFATLAAVYGVPSAEGAGRVFAMSTLTVAPGVVVAGWLARRSGVPWSLSRIAFAVIAVTAVVVVATALRGVLTAVRGGAAG